MGIEELKQTITAARERIDAAAYACGRSPREISLELAVKTRTEQECRAGAQALHDLGLPLLLGHNRVQEGLATVAAIREIPAVTLSLIGPLQSNKINASLKIFDRIETVDSLSLAQAISMRAVRAGREIGVFIQVNTSAEATKSGISPDQAPALALAVATLPALKLEGFMTVGANTPDQTVVRSSYQSLRIIRDQVQGSGVEGTEDAIELSMGMSGDLELSISQGATIVRLGTAIFGSRTPTVNA